MKKIILSLALVLGVASGAQAVYRRDRLGQGTLQDQ